MKRVLYSSVFSFPVPSVTFLFLQAIWPYDSKVKSLNLSERLATLIVVKSIYRYLINGFIPGSLETRQMQKFVVGK